MLPYIPDPYIIFISGRGTKLPVKPQEVLKYQGIGPNSTCHALQVVPVLVQQMWLSLKGIF